MFKDRFLRRTDSLVIVSALALLITGLVFSMTGYQHEQELVATLSLNETALVGPAGADGKDGAPGKDGRNGTDGTPGTPGIDGANGATGAAGANGTAGSPGSTGATGSAGIDAAITGIQYYSHEVATATNGGTLSTGTWTVRTINTVLSGGNLHGTFTSLASNTITFQPGVYRISASAAIGNVERNVMRIRDITTSTNVASGLSTWPLVMNIVDGILNATTARDVQIQHWIQTSAGTGGMGLPATGSPGVPNTYLLVEIMKLYA